MYLNYKRFITLSHILSKDDVKSYKIKPAWSPLDRGYCLEGFQKNISYIPEPHP